MENGDLVVSTAEDTRIQSPIEEDSFREKIQKNRDKLRTSSDINGYSSQTDSEPETGVSEGETDSGKEEPELNPEEHLLQDQNEIITKFGDSSSSSSSSSESSDSENEDLRASSPTLPESMENEVDQVMDVPNEDDVQSNLSANEDGLDDVDRHSPEEEMSPEIALSDKDDIPSDSEAERKRSLPIVLDTSSSESDSDEEKETTNSGDFLAPDVKDPVENEDVHPPLTSNEDNSPDIVSDIDDEDSKDTKLTSSSDSDSDMEESIPKYTHDDDQLSKAPTDKLSGEGILSNAENNDDIVGDESLKNDSSSSSSSESENEDEKSSSDLEDHHQKDLSHIRSSQDLPIVLDTSSESEPESEPEPDKDIREAARRSSSSSSSENDEQDENDQEEKDDHQDDTSHPGPISLGLHGQNESPKEHPALNGHKDASCPSSSSSSESETEEEVTGPLVVRQKEEGDSSLKGDNTDIALSLRKALEEREKELERRRQEENEPELGARKSSRNAVQPTTPDYMQTPSPDAFNFNGDPSLRARTANDFEELKIPPKLPPKKRDLMPPIVSPDIGVHRIAHHPPVPRARATSPQHTVDIIHPNIFHVKDKTASLGRGMWSEDDEDDSDFIHPRHHSASSHPPPDRVIDFSNNPDGDHSLRRSSGRNTSGRKRSSSRRRSKEKLRSRSRSPSGSGSGHRVIDFNRQYEDSQDAINKQAMVSLHANTYDTDAYDSVQETGDELNKLIEKANSLGIRHSYPEDGQDVYPKRKLREKNLDSKHQDAFAKIVAPIPKSKSPQHQYRAIPQGPSAGDLVSSDNSKRSNRSSLRKKRKITPPVEAVDGDDEISIAESDLQRFAPPPATHTEEHSIPFVTTEVYPSDYTEFESYSEAEFLEVKKSVRSSSFSSDNTVQEPYNATMHTGGESAYDTVADNDLDTDIDFQPQAKLNPIVSANFQICSDLSKSKSFPARLKEGKPKKERPSLSHMAIPLHHSKKNVYPSSLPYFPGDFYDYDETDRAPRRTGSYDDIRNGGYPVNTPSIVVHRHPTHPRGYRPELVQEVLVQNTAAPPLPEKKKKKEKKTKEPVDKSMPKIHLSVGQHEGESNENVNNNLQINLLPSDDPNVINLNIRSTSVSQSGPQSLPVSLPQAYPPVTSEPVSIRPEFITPVTSVVHTPWTDTNVAKLDSQHRVVEVNAPPMVVTGDEIQPTVPFSTNGGVVLAGGVATEILPNPVLAAAAQQFTQNSAPQPTSYPTVSLGAQPIVTAPMVQPQILATQSLPVASPIVDTSITSMPIQQPPLQANNQPTVVDIHRPGALPEDRHGSLPSSLREGRLHHGDSGIDLTVHDRARHPGDKTPKPRRMRRTASRASSRRDMTSSDEDDSKRNRRKSSRKRLKSNDFLDVDAPSKEYMDWYKSKYLKPSCHYLFMKHTMFVINLLFTLAGLVLVGLGIWGLTRLYSNDITDPSLIFLDPLTIALIVGFVMTLVAFHGAAGFLRDNICMLKCFGSFLVMLFIVFVIGGIVFWAMMSQVKEFTINTFGDLIKQYDPETREGLSFAIDLMQNNFECCGISDPGTSDWQKNKNYKCPDAHACPMPSSCCRKVQDKKFKCQTSSDLSYQKPCINKMTSAVSDNTPVIVGVWIGIWALMMIEMIFIHFMCKEIQYLQKIRDVISNPRRQYKPMNNHNDSEEETSDSYDDESSSDYSSSEEEYRRKRKRSRKRSKSKKDRRGRKNRRNSMGKRTTSKRGRRGSYHVNKTFSIEDERAPRRKRSRKGSRSRSRSRSRRGSY